MAKNKKRKGVKEKQLKEKRHRELIEIHDVRRQIKKMSKDKMEQDEKLKKYQEHLEYQKEFFNGENSTIKKIADFYND